MEDKTVTNSQKSDTLSFGKDNRPEIAPMTLNTGQNNHQVNDKPSVT
jgi:hypothetical protein